MARSLTLYTAALLMSAGAAFAQNLPARPNVVLIMMDDAGYGDYGSYGAPDIRTPNIDRLAREGVRFTDFYAAPSCTPTRVAFITGRYQQRVGLEVPLSNAPAGGRGLTATGRGLAQLLKNREYATGLVGKWHLGYLPEFHPNAHGFDYFFGFLSGLIDYYQHTGPDGNHDLWENREPAHVQGYSTDLITQRAVGFIERNAKQPFFLEVAYNAAHWPFQVPDKPSTAPGRGRFVQPQEENTGTRAEYVAILERADRGVGTILAALQKLGLERNTLVIFTNDNGGEWLSRNAPLFHRKETLWEGGIRVPLLMRWPGQIPSGRTERQVGMVFDLTATILAVAGAAVPPETRLDGINLMPIVMGTSPAVERTLFWRVATAAPVRNQRAVRQGDWKVFVEAGKVFVFNLRDDPGERNDLARERQDIARKLFPLIAAWEKDVDAEGGGVGVTLPGRGGAAPGRGGAPARGAAPERGARSW
jgi:arylsulfatase A-like enzyme